MPSLTVSPAHAMIDVKRTIRLAGFPEGDVTLTTTMREIDGTDWQSQASFANTGAPIDVSTDAPIAGDWSAASAMAPIWAMHPIRHGSGVKPMGPIATAPLTVHLAANGITAEMSLNFLAPGVTRTDIRENGIVGTLFSRGTQAPLVVLLAGSGGGLMERRAALYAAHGYQALALGYFGVPGLPDHISGTKLEYFQRALTWAHQTLTPANGFLALSGVSRGGELALLVASRYPALVSAVVAYVPSPFTHGVLNAGKPGEDRHAPAWFAGNQPLPVLSAPNQTANWALFDEAPAPRRQSPAFLSALEDKAAAARAMIPLENIAGPVLLISGEDDALWPSATFAEIARTHLAAANHPHAVEHLAYPNAGHTIDIPYLPTTVLSRPHPVSQIPLAYGGTAEGNAAASAASWTEVLRFLSQAVAAKA